ncbi:ORF4 [Lonestar tick chuvirus 1]|uniref:ORF4 n=1 Tax=Lonestar tick chuvirus 1 TaxID=1844927 RepID=A0A172MHP1_9VIRU|nr:ORF4 [Lonestar tick chuvirus 1]ANC97700.1 ORF4 [Lonestar tick chuvirus 1]
MYPSDAANVVTAMQTVGTDKYYGFKRDLGVVRSTQYKSFAFVAKMLLQKYGGAAYSNIGQYEGWPKDIAGRSTIEEAINEFNPLSTEADDAAVTRVNILRGVAQAATGLDS